MDFDFILFLVWLKNWLKVNGNTLAYFILAIILLCSILWVYRISLIHILHSIWNCNHLHPLEKFKNGNLNMLYAIGKYTYQLSLRALYALFACNLQKGDFIAIFIMVWAAFVGFCWRENFCCVSFYFVWHWGPSGNIEQNHSTTLHRAKPKPGYGIHV